MKERLSIKERILTSKPARVLGETVTAAAPALPLGQDSLAKGMAIALFVRINEKVASKVGEVMGNRN